jgi:4-amino-4-deoxychorismate lyase
MDFSLIETIQWSPQEGFVRLDQHMRRLARSADALGFRQPQGVEAALKDKAGGDRPLKMRLTMNYRGRLDVEASPFDPPDPDRRWTLRIARTRLRSDDALYRHKTSRREPYEAARAEFKPAQADEVILLNERGEICEGTTTNVFIDDGGGVMLTPALSCGLLPGILRAGLIRERKARSEVLKLKDLEGKTLYVGNSLLGLVRAELVEEFA